MTKQEVLNGALALNGEEKNYIIKVEGDKIIIEVKYKDAIVFSPLSPREDLSIFRSIACLNDDKTFVEIHKHIESSKGIFKFMKSVSYGHKVEKSISFGYNKNTGKTGAVVVNFNSKEYIKIVREYLEGCGYKRTRRGFLKRLFKKKVSKEE